MRRIVIQGTKATVGRRSVSVSKFIERVSPTHFDTSGIIFPSGFKTIIQTDRHKHLVFYEFPPAVTRLRWIADPDTGEWIEEQGARYLNVRIALPYLVFGIGLCTYDDTEFTGGGVYTVAFRNAPLESVDDPLYHPVLPNFQPHALGGECCHFSTSYTRCKKINECIRNAYTSTMRDFFGGKYNNHMGSLSLWERYRKIDPRIRSIKAWQAATAKDPSFILTVPWVRTGYTIRDAAFNPATHPASAANLARIVFNYRPTQS